MALILNGFLKLCLRRLIKYTARFQENMKEWGCVDEIKLKQALERTKTFDVDVTED
jgi:hypothetical protein